MNITAKMVADLREKTGAGMMDCKKALVAANGDMEAAIENLRKSIAKMNEIDATLNSDAVNGMKKKEVASMSHRAEKLHRDLDGIAEMKKLPKVMVVVDVNNEMNAVREAIRLHIPIVAIVDTNGDPTLVDYPVAANDEAVRSVGIITNIFAEAIKVAKEIYNKRAAEEREAAEVAKRVAEEQAANNAETEAKAE